MAEPAASRLLAHTGATITGVLGNGRFGTVFLVRRGGGGGGGERASGASSSVSYYAAKVVLLEDRRDRRGSRGSSPTSGGSRSRYGSGARSSPAPSMSSGRSSNAAESSRSSSSSSSSSSSNVGSVVSEQGERASDFLLAEDDDASPVGNVGGGADPLFVSTTSALPGSPSSHCAVPAIPLSKMFATLDPAVASLRREVDLLQSLRPAPGDHVVGFVGSHRNYECEALLMEYMEGGSVRALLERREETRGVAQKHGQRRRQHLLRVGAPAGGGGSRRVSPGSVRDTGRVSVRGAQHGVNLALHRQLQRMRVLHDVPQH